MECLISGIEIWIVLLYNLIAVVVNLNVQKRRKPISLARLNQIFLERVRRVMNKISTQSEVRQQNERKRRRQPHVALDVKFENVESSAVSEKESF